MPNNASIQMVLQGQATQLVYRYGVRITPDSEQAVAEQIRKARKLYNDIIAVMRQVQDEAQAFILARAGPAAQALQHKIEQTNTTFQIAKTVSNEAVMQHIAQERRELWRDLTEILKTVRQEHKEILKEQFYSRIGNKAVCETYQCRTTAVMAGLGSATASKVLEAALKAWQMSIVKGHAPRFIRADEKQQDTLTLQFSEAGGCPMEKILSGKRKELIVQPPQKGFSPRSYSPFSFRLGAAKDKQYAEGSIQWHRGIPDGAHIALARLIRRRSGPKFQYELQLLATLPEPIQIAPPTQRKPLVAIHFGWSSDENGRRLAGVSDNGNPLDASLIHLPPSIEADLHKASQLQSQRDAARNAIYQQLKEEPALETSEENSALSAHWNRIRQSPAAYISASHLHYLVHLLREQDTLPEWFNTWEKNDKRAWKEVVSWARRARNRRKNYYQKIALELASQYETIVLEMPDLKKAAKKTDAHTGQKTAMIKQARNGRVVAALHLLESAIQWAACRYGVALLNLTGEKTSRICALCGGTHLKAAEADPQMLYCTDCHNLLDRKRNGAANAWKAVTPERERLVTLYWQETLEKQKNQADKKRRKLQKMAEARKATA